MPVLQGGAPRNPRKTDPWMIAEPGEVNQSRAVLGVAADLAPGSCRLERAGVSRSPN